ncbi:DUF5721 family protein [Anaeropeptidivorans aminofermentans]|jgi:hypothetical protein|uniref:DUF5721 family protein n=1 Tax=Anaeropeptidivorans aminofermentans TaxID=2934315 RepID=UPI00202442C8|nr:DUF5721 family protein [Anaeropeptidivorans aminofermentans]MBE6011910.1 hypothetical protein [Lachnospiraceae bacterium]
MLSFSVPLSEVKDFMASLFKKDVFDFFEVRGVEIITFTKFEISAIISSDEEDERTRNFCIWEELRPYAFDIIKGNKKPKAIKIIFSMPQEKAEVLHQNAGALYLNLIYNGNEINLSTATSQKTFALNKELDLVWEEYIKNFFKENKIAVVYDN